MEVINNFYPETDEDEIEAPVEVIAPKYEPFASINDWILMKRIDEENGISKGGLVIPEAARERSKKGEIVSIGEQVSSVKPGDLVVFGDYSTEKLELNGVEFTQVRISDVRGVERLIIQ